MSGFSVWVRESGSLWSFPGILLVHTYGMGIMVGVILAVDLSILGLVPALPLAPLQKFFPLVWIAFWLNAITGTILLAADATTKLTNPDFGVKMGFIVLAVINQRMIRNACSVRSRLRRLPEKRSPGCRLSVGLVRSL